MTTVTGLPVLTPPPSIAVSGLTAPPAPPPISISGLSAPAPSPSLPASAMTEEPEKKAFPGWAIALIVIFTLLIIIAGGVFAYQKFKGANKNVRLK